MEYLPPPLSCHISLDNYFPSSCLLTHLPVKNIRASGVLNKNRLYKYTIIGDKQQQSHIKQEKQFSFYSGWLERQQSAQATTQRCS